MVDRNTELVFPQENEIIYWEGGEEARRYERTGLTVRDYFAARAMEAFIREGVSPRCIGPESYRMADDMLRSRSLPPQGETTEGGSL